MVANSNKLQDLLASNDAFRKSFQGLCERFERRVVIWTPEVCFLAKKTFEDMFRAYELDVLVEVQRSFDGAGRFVIHFN